MADPLYDLIDAAPIRAGANPTLDPATAGLGPPPQPGFAYITSLVLSMLRWHFADASRIEMPDLVGRVYTANSATTQLQIESLAEWKPDLSNVRPALLVDRLEQEKDLGHRGIGDQLQGNKPGWFLHYMQGSHVVHCLGGREGEADILAAEVWKELTRFADVYRTTLCLQRWLPTKVGKRNQLSQEYKEHYSTPILITYVYSEQWRRTILSEAEITEIRGTFST